MTRRKCITILAVGALLIAAVAYIAFEWKKAAREQKARAQVYYWIRSMDWWDYTLTEAENLGRQLNELRKLRPQAVDVFRRDLGYEPARHKLLRKLSFLNKVPFVNRLLPQPDDPDGPEEVRHRAAYYLGVFGPEACDAVPELLSRSADPDDRVRFEVAFSLGRIGVDSPAVQAALARMLGDKDKTVQFSAAIALWLLEPDTEKSVSRVQSLISTNYLGWPSICLQKIGPAGRVFVPAVERAMAGMPWSYGRMQAVHALWSMTGERQRILGELESLSQAINQPGSTNSTTGWTSVEEEIGYVVHTFDDEQAFRDATRPILKQILANPNSPARKMASVYLERFDMLDRRAAGEPGEQPSKSSAGR